MAKINQAMQDLLRYNAAILPQKRSTFDKSHSHTTTMDSAFLVPLFYDRVLPGDEKKIRYSGLARMATPKVPVMDEAKLDVWCFYVPDRLWWSHAREFYGENLDASFNTDGEYVMPYLTPDQFRVDPSIGGQSYDDVPPDTMRYINGIGSLNDYFGFPIISDGYYHDDGGVKVTAGLHRSYQLIWNEYFRNSSIQPALQLSQGDNVTEQEWNVIRQIRKVCKYPDFFTSLLREPQAGDSVTLPLGEWAPVVTRDVSTWSGDGDPNTPAVQVRFANGGGTSTYYADPAALLFNPKAPNDIPMVASSDGMSSVPGGSHEVTFNNLWADLTDASSATINNIRAAVTIQQLLEIDAIAGKRYQNILYSHFGTLTPDATLQRPELLGATRANIGMRQVLQTSETTDSSPQGNTAAFSLTNIDNDWICNKAFTEPGFIMVLGAIRPVQSYSQGIDPLLTKLQRYDHYWPVFDNLGNQPVPTSAIYYSYNSGRPDNGEYANYLPDVDDVFGYSEAWTEYRIRNNRVSGLMRPDLFGGVNQHATLSYWNYAVDFNGAPQLDSAFVEEDEHLIDRAIAVPSEPQFIIDSYFDYKDTKNMSVHSVPGLLRL